MRVAAFSALALLFALSACGDAKDSKPDERKTAAGQVLGGSISDGMLPLSTVQSKSPPLRESASEGASGEDGEAAPSDDEREAREAPAARSSATVSAPAAEVNATSTPPAAQ